MRAIRTLLLAVAALMLVSIIGCGGTDQRAEMPNAALTDRSADDMGLPAEEPEAEPDPAEAEGEAEPEEAAEPEPAE